jgi:hypothetical protein
LSELSVPRPTVVCVPTYRHETLIELFRSRPALAAELLGGVLGLAQWYVGRGKAEGKAEGEANAVLVVLEARRIEVPDATRERIAGCRDLAQLEVWVRRAATAASVDDLFVHASDQAS